LPQPWCSALAAVARRPTDSPQEVWLEGRCFQCRKAQLDDAPSADGLVLLVADLTEQKQLQSQLAHQDRLASVGRLAAGVAHEIGNPLTGIASLAQNLRAEPDPTQVGERVELILEQTRRIERIVRSLMRFSHAGEPLPSAARDLFEVRAALEEALGLVRLSRKARSVTCLSECPAEVSALGDRQQLIQVFVNLLANACDASRPGSRVLVRAAADEARTRIDVIDEGSGIPEEIRGRIFEPFFTTKPPGEGTGLGLAVAWSIVHEHRGRIEVASAPGQGTTVTVLLPRLERLADERVAS
jgi:signal transduction histidine kinase